MTTILLNGKEYQLGIEQAEKLGLLKEKDNKVKSWDEYVKKYVGLHGYSYNMNMDMITHSETPIYTADQLTRHEAKALAAYSRLLKLRRDWIGEWEPDWTDYTTCKFVIGYVNDSIIVNTRNTTARSLSFPTEQMAREFRETFRDLIEKAKTLI